MAEITLTKDNFQAEVMESPVPVLVDFWASWCGPCQMLGPVVSEIAGEAGDAYKVGKVNVDEEVELAQQYGIMSIPTIMVFKGGEVAQRTMGVQPKEDLLALLK